MSKFWGKFEAVMSLFDELMDELPSEIKSQTKTIIKKKTVNGKVVEDVVIIDGVEYVPKKETK